MQPIAAQRLRVLVVKQPSSSTSLATIYQWMFCAGEWLTFHKFTLRMPSCDHMDAVRNTTVIMLSKLLCHNYVTTAQVIKIVFPDIL